MDRPFAPHRLLIHAGSCKRGQLSLAHKVTVGQIYPTGHPAEMAGETEKCQRHMQSLKLW